MSDLIIKPAVPETCGTCKFGRAVPQDLQVVDCHGVPPTPCVVGGQQTVRGPAYAVELMHARMARAEPACALWKLTNRMAEADWMNQAIANQ